MIRLFLIILSIEYQYLGRLPHYVFEHSPSFKLSSGLGFLLFSSLHFTIDFGEAEEITDKADKAV